MIEKWAIYSNSQNRLPMKTNIDDQAVSLSTFAFLFVNKTANTF